MYYYVHRCTECSHLAVDKLALEKHMQNKHKDKTKMREKMAKLRTTQELARNTTTNNVKEEDVNSNEEANTRNGVTLVTLAKDDSGREEDVDNEEAPDSDDHSRGDESMEDEVDDDEDVASNSHQVDPAPMTSAGPFQTLPGQVTTTMAGGGTNGGAAGEQQLPGFQWSFVEGGDVSSPSSSSSSSTPPAATAFTTGGFFGGQEASNSDCQVRQNTYIVLLHTLLPYNGLQVTIINVGSFFRF